MDLKQAENQTDITCILSAIVYNDNCANVLKDNNFRKVQFFDKGGAQAVAGVRDDTTYIVFRGTEPSELNDLKADLKAWRVKDPTTGFKVHAGFCAEVDDIWNEICIWYEANKTDKLVITGHSLGAAMATIAASRLPADELYTYGSPRVGGYRFRRFMNKKCKIYRYVNNNDIVCRVPGPIIYDHVGTLCYINSAGKVIENASIWVVIKGWFIGTWRALKEKDWADALTDHMITDYYKMIKK